MKYAINHCECERTPTHCVYTGHCIGGCGEVIKVEVPLAEVRAYEKGALIQDAMPSLSASDREFLISGICGVCFDLMEVR